MRDMPEPDEAAPVALTVIAFDFGLRRIGVAVGQTVTASASALGVIDNGPAGPDFARIEALVAEWRPEVLVVGMPGTADGSPSELEPAVDEFVAALERFGLPVSTVDERHTSVEARGVLKAARRAGSRGRIQKEHVDAAAAVLIAERFLATHRN